MDFTVTCYDKKTTYDDSQLKEVLNKYIDLYYEVDPQSNEARRYLNIVGSLYLEKTDITDNEGNLAPEIEKHKVAFLSFMKKEYTKNHSISRENLNFYVFKKISNLYPLLPNESVNALMEKVVDKAFEIAKEAEKNDNYSLIKKISTAKNSADDKYFIDYMFLEELITERQFGYKLILNYDFSFKEEMKNLINCKESVTPDFEVDKFIDREEFEERA